jgi:LPS O-antigen subunit length determinant protein (WzzB/FepE family)
MDTHSPQQVADDEIDLLDLLVTVADNIKLLVLGPIVVGLAALGVGYTLPQTFQSTSLLAVEKSVSSLNANVVTTLATTAAVLDPVAQQLGLLDQGLSIDQARSRLQGQVVASVGRNDKLLNITTTATQPQQAQLLNQLVVQQVFEQTRPRGAELARLQAQLAQEQTSYATSTQLEQTLAKLLASGKAQDKTSETYATLLAANSARLFTIQTLEAQLAGLQPSDMVQPATLPEQAIKPKKSLIAVVAALATGFALLLFVFVRQALRNSGTNPESAAKLARIRRALGLR